MISPLGAVLRIIIRELPERPGPELLVQLGQLPGQTTPCDPAPAAADQIAQQRAEPDGASKNTTLHSSRRRTGEQARRARSLCGGGIRGKGIGRKEARRGQGDGDRGWTGNGHDGVSGGAGSSHQVRAGVTDRGRSRVGDECYVAAFTEDGEERVEPASLEWAW